MIIQIVAEVNFISVTVHDDNNEKVQMLQLTSFAYSRTTDGWNIGKFKHYRKKENISQDQIAATFSSEVNRNPQKYQISKIHL